MMISWTAFSNRQLQLRQHFSISVSREAEPVVEGESAPWEEGTPMKSEEAESPVQTEEGSGGYEGSAAEGSFMADWAFAPAATETGSGESWTGEDKGEDKGTFWEGS